MTHKLNFRKIFNKKLVVMDSLSIRYKIGISFSIFSFLVSALIVFSIYFSVKKHFYRAIKERLLDVVSISRQLVDGDELEALAGRSDESSAGYKKIQNTLQDIRKSSLDIHFIYTMRKNKKGEIEFLVDADDKEGEMVHLGEVFSNAPQFLKDNFTKKKSIVSPEFITDKWGTFLIGYSPVYNSNDKFVGVIGVDIESGRVLSKIKTLFLITIIILLLSIPLSIVLGFYCGRRLSYPILELTNIAKLVIKGNWDIPVKVYSGDELGVLANVFNVMIRKLKKIINELTVANIEIEKSNQLKGAFLAGMGHEIRTPMNGILGMNDLLLESGLKGKQVEYAKSLQYSAKYLLSFLNNMLDYSRAELGEEKVSNTSFNIRNLVENISDICISEVLSKELKIYTVVDNNIPENIIGDYDKIKRVLLGLCSNAIKFTDDGYIKILVKKVEEDDRSFLIKFAVEDTGIGFCETHCEQIFSPFYQIETIYKKKYKGAGLGLAICKDLTNLLEGHIYATSKRNKGSSFYLDLKLTKVEFDEASHSSMLIRKSKAIFISSDSNQNEVIESSFEFYGVSSTWINDIGKAIEYINYKKNDFDFVVIDDCLKKTDLERLLDSLSFLIKLKNKKIIQLKSFGDNIEVLSEMKGVSTFIDRRIKQIELYDCLFNVVEKENILPENLRKNLAANILVVEDNSINQQIMESYITNLGYKYHSALNGKVAVEMLTKKNYDLIFMDIQMPVMSGLEATKIIRNTLNLDTPIIALSANDGSEEREIGYKSGFSEFISKPISSKEVAEVFSRWIL